MLPVVWHPDSELDLLEIIQFIGERNPLAAVNLADLLRNSVVHLSGHPYLFKSSTRVHGCREIVVHPNYLVFYKVLVDQVLVVKVAHSRQQFPI